MSVNRSVLGFIFGRQGIETQDPDDAKRHNDLVDLFTVLQFTMQDLLDLPDAAEKGVPVDAERLEGLCGVPEAVRVYIKCCHRICIVPALPGEVPPAFLFYGTTVFEEMWPQKRGILLFDHYILNRRTTYDIQ